MTTQAVCIAVLVAASLTPWLGEATFAHGLLAGFVARTASAACTVAVLCVACFAGPLSARGELRLAFCTFFIPLGCALLAASLLLQGVPGVVLLVCGYCAAGLGQGAAILSAAVRMSTLDAPAHGVLFAAGSLAGVALAACAALVPSSPWLVFLVCAFASGAACIASSVGASGAGARLQELRYKDASIIKLRTSLAISSQTMLAGTVILCTCTAYPQVMPCALAGCALGVLLELANQLVKANTRLSPAIVQRGCIGLFILSALLFDFLLAVGFPGIGVCVFAFCSCVAMGLLFVFNFNTLVMEAREFSLERSEHFGRGFLGVWAGVLVGVALVALLAAMLPHVPADRLGFWLATALVVVMLVVGFVCKPDESEDFEVLQTFLFPSNEVDDARLDAEQPSTAQRCQLVATRFGLTPRETEVLELLAHGRNAKFVQEKLTVSLSTAKTHIYHIYQKLQVNSQQQLLDCIDHASELQEREIRSGD